MERKSLYAYAAIFVVLAVLLIVIISNYYTIASLNDQLGFYKKQQREFSRIVTAQHLADMEAARNAWISASQRDYVSLKNQGISVEADSIETQDYTAVIDLKDPSGTSLDFTPGSVAPGEVVVYLGQYYSDNMTRASGWTTSYRVNTTTHTVAGITSLLVQNVAGEYYTGTLAPDIYQKLGVSSDAVQGSTSRSIDRSYLPESGNWVDVTEYRYSFRNTGVKSYLLVKTYVNATSQSVVGVDVSKPYFSSVTGVDY